MRSKAKLVVLKVMLFAFVTLLAGCNGSSLPTSISSVVNTTSTSVSESANTNFITISCPLIQADPLLQRREALLSRSGVQVKLKYDNTCRTQDDILNHAITSVNSGDDVDAYLLVYRQSDAFAQKLNTPDLTQDIAQDATNLKKYYEQQNIAGPFYGLPISWEDTLFGGYAIAVSKELSDKYNPTINSVQDYFNFLQLIHKNEPDCTPGVIDTSWGMDTLLTVSGYVDASMFFQIDSGHQCLYLRPDDPLNTIAYAEDIPEVVEAIKTIRQLQKDSLLVPANYIGQSKFASLAMGLSRTALSRYATNSVLGAGLRDMKIFPVERQLVSSESANVILYSLVPSPNSPKKNDVLWFVEWLMTSSSNYQLARYGELDREYKLEGDRISFSVNEDDLAYSDYGFSYLLSLPEYDLETTRQPFNAVEALSTSGLSSNCVTKMIEDNPQEYYQLASEFEEKLTGDYNDFINTRRTAFDSILYGTGEPSDVDDEMARLLQDASFLEIYRSFLTRLLEN